MNSQIRYKNNYYQGFSLIEFLVVIGIFTVFATISVSTYVNFKMHNNLAIATNELAQALRYAQSNSQLVNSDSRWGVKVLADEIIIFKGDDYNSRDVSADQNIDIPIGINTSGLSEIIFEKLSGQTINTGTIVLTNNTEIKNVLINEKGTITY